ncbi:acyl--CoA ligase [Salmonella enterica]
MITLRRLNEIAITRGNDICIIDKERQYTWYDIIRRTKSRIVFLRRAFNPEQLRSVCYLSKNSVDLICWLAAFATLGIPANGLDYSLPIETLRGLLIKINPGLMLVSFSLYSPDELNKLHVRTITMLAVDAPTDPVIGSIGEFHHPELESLLATHIPAPFRSVSLTSGTSSAPKIVLRYNSFDARRFDWFTQRFNFTHHDGFLLILPLYHAAGNGWARMFMGLGASLHLVDQDDESALIQALSLNSVKATVMTPNLVSRLTKLASETVLHHYLRWVLVGGSYFPVKSKIAAYTHLGHIFNEYYGCTETGVNVLSESSDMFECPGSVGRAFDGNKIRILDEDNVPLKAGNRGRIAVASYMLMDEYGDGSRPFIEIDSERYFLMADYGYLDDNGRLFLMNRNSEIKCEQDIYHIEEHLRALPCITDVALIPIRQQNKDHIRCIFSAKHINEDDVSFIMDEIKNKINHIGVTDFTAHMVDKIPYSPSGKVRFSEIVQTLTAA